MIRSITSYLSVSGPPGAVDRFLETENRHGLYSNGANPLFPGAASPQNPIFALSRSIFGEKTVHRFIEDSTRTSIDLERLSKAYPSLSIHEYTAYPRTPSANHVGYRGGSLLAFEDWSSDAAKTADLIASFNEVFPSFSALHSKVADAAAATGNLQSLPRDLLSPALFTRLGAHGQTPLHVAAELGYLYQLPTHLLTQDTLDIPDNNGRTAFEIAQGHGFLGHIPKTTQDAIAARRNAELAAARPTAAEKSISHENARAADQRENIAEQIARDTAVSLRETEGIAKSEERLQSAQPPPNTLAADLTPNQDGPGQPPQVSYIRSSTDTRTLRLLKEDLYKDHFPVAQTRQVAAQFFSPSKYESLRGKDQLTYLVAPSTTGENTLPLAVAQLLQQEYGGTIVTGWATPQATQRTATLGGIGKLRQPPRYNLQHDVLQGIAPGATLVLVDDVVTTGGSIAAMREALASTGLRADLVASLAQSDLRLVKNTDVERIVGKLMPAVPRQTEREAFASAEGFQSWAHFVKEVPDATIDSKNGFNLWRSQQRASLIADASVALDGRLKHFANYIETSIHQKDDPRNLEVSEYFHAESRRLQELGDSLTGRTLGIRERLAAVEGLQPRPRFLSGSDLAVSRPRETRDLRPGQDGRENGSLDPLTLALEKLDAMRQKPTGRDDALKAGALIDALPGSDLTKIPLRTAAQQYVAGQIGHQNLFAAALQHRAVLTHYRPPSQGQNQGQDLGLSR